MFASLNKTIVRNRTSLSFSIQIYLLKSILYTKCPFLFYFNTSFLYHNTHVNRYLLSVFLRDLHDRGAGAQSNRESYAYADF